MNYEDTNFIDIDSGSGIIEMISAGIDKGVLEDCKDIINRYCFHDELLRILLF